MKEKLIYIYDIYQAEFMIKNLKADGFYRLGKGTQGDICVSFLDIPKVHKVIDLWSKHSKQIN